MAEDMRPPSMDDYTDTETTGRPVPTIPVDTTTGEEQEEFTTRKLARALGVEPYVGPWNLSRQAAKEKGYTSFDRARMLATAAGKRAMALLLFDDDAVTDAYEVSQEVGNNLDWGDDVRSTFRHLLLGGLVESKQGQKYINEEKESGLDLESIIDRNNNLFGKSLREKYPDREEFIQAALATAVALGDGEEVEPLDGRKLRLSVEGKYDETHSDAAMMEGIEDIGERKPMSAVPTRPDNIVEPDPRKSTDDYTVTQKKGGIMKAQQGIMPMTKATSNPTGNKPPETVDVPRGVGRPKNQPESNDVRDIAIAKLKDSIGLKKGAVKIDEELKEGTKPKESTGMSVMIGLGAPEIEYSKGEEGDPPPGATKEEVADDQMVLMSEGELVVPANVVRYHGLATYEGMRRDALSGLQEMEFDGQISYIDEGKTKKTREGGIMKAQQGITPLPATAEAASSQFLMRPQNMEVYTPARPFPLQSPVTQPGYPQVSQYTPVYPTYAGLAGSPKVVAPNIGYYLPEEQRSSFMRPDAYPTGVVPTATSIGAPPAVNPIPFDVVSPGVPHTAQPTTTTTPAEPPKVVSEEQGDYIRSGQADQEISKVDRALQEAEQAREDESRRTYPEFEGFNKFQDDVKDLYGKDFTGAFDTLQDSAAKGFKDLIRKPVDLKTTSPFDKDAGKYGTLPLSNLPTAFLESITNPQRAAIRNENYNPSKLDIVAALNPSIRFDSKALQTEADKLTPDQLKQYGYDVNNPNTVRVFTGKYDSDGDPITQELGTYTGTTQEALARANRTYDDKGMYTSREKSKRRGERKEQNAIDSGFASQGIEMITTEELNAHRNINASLNEGQYDPNGLMGIEQYADLKKTKLPMKNFMALSRAEQSFYAAARTGDTVDAWVVDAMKEGTTAAFDAMNKTNNANVLSNFEVAADKQYKPTDVKEKDFQVNVMSYWQSEEGRNKAKELGLEVG